MILTDTAGLKFPMSCIIVYFTTYSLTEH